MRYILKKDRSPGIKALLSSRLPGLQSDGVILKTYIKSLRPRQAADTELNGGERDKGRQCRREVLVILGKATVAAEPGEGALHDPAPRQHDEALHVVGSLDDLDA